MEVRTKFAGTGREEKRVDLGGHVELVDERVSARQDPAKDQSLIQRLGRAITASLKGDRRRRSEEMGGEMEALLGLYPPVSRG